MRLFHQAAPCPGINGRPQLPRSSWFEMLQDVTGAEVPALRLVKTVKLCTDLAA